MEEKQLNVLYEDNQVVVVLKPHNMPSQADASGDMDLLSMVKAYVKEKYNKPGEAFIGLVHRLDRPTGGVMVFARTSKAAARLSEELKNGQMKKTYFAVCAGTPQAKEDTLINFLKKDEKENIVKIVTRGEEGNKRAELNYKVLEVKDGQSLVKVNIVTGRSHQIRVQLAGIGNPLVGDNKYGRSKFKASKNLGLWAGILEFVHPTTKEKMVFACPPDAEKEPWSKFNIQKYFMRGR